ncbi:hypothetical protein BJ165DRAFT_1384778 [Panaeolus papilionaceus]|nr:hypothetical protein BJ165DRAFT_1384778 [Panaeolus papilionaceus]
MLLHKTVLASLFTLAGLFHQGVAHHTPDRHHPPSCGAVLQRREWRTFSDHEKSEYIDAVLCLQNMSPENPDDQVSRNRFDEFQALHIAVADQVHLVGHFLAWHRYFLHRYERELKEKCGYNGANPYWDWSIDADSPDPESITKAPVFDPHTGFGGDGVPGTYTVPDDPSGTSRIFVNDFRGCISNGPFVNYRPIHGPGKFVGDHCLTRGIDNTMKVFLNTTIVNNTLARPNFELFRIDLEGLPITPTHMLHDGGHIAIGGEMSNIYSSPGEPLFYLHHANLDRIWWKWQHSKRGRLWEITGRSTTTPPFVNVTLDYMLIMGTLANDVPIRDVMDTHQSPQCYTYA